jgi:alpha-beta hydrolase superfamily lysophospholipase
MPANDMHAMLVIIHGLAEHSGRYSHVADYFAGKGYAVGAFDLYGHGKSGGKKAFIQQFDRLMDDMEAFVGRAVEKAKGRDVFLLGHSMGGGMVTRYLMDRNLNGVKGAMLSAPMVAVGSSIPPFLITVTRILGDLVPTLPVVQLDNDTISRDPHVKEKYDSDPLNYRGKIQARTGTEINRFLEYVQTHMDQITLPVLIMQGSDDRLVDPAGSRQLYEKASSKDKTLKIYDGLYHEILNEPEKQQVMNDILAWMLHRNGRY